MMSVTQELVNSAFCMQIPLVCLSQGKKFLYFCNKLSFGGHFVCILIFFLLDAKCLQLDSNFIANNLREKWV